MRKWLFKPKLNDTRPLSQFFWADEDMCLTLKELGSFVGRKEPLRCTKVVTKMRLTQCHILSLIEQMINDNFPRNRVSYKYNNESLDQTFTEYIKHDFATFYRTFRLKYPDDMNLAPTISNNISTVYDEMTFHNYDVDPNPSLSTTLNVSTLRLRENLSETIPTFQNYSLYLEASNSNTGTLINASNINGITASFPEYNIGQIRHFDTTYNHSSLQNNHLYDNQNSPPYPGFIWFVAECLAVTSLTDPVSGNEHPEEYRNLIAQSKRFVTSLDLLRKCLRTQALIDPSIYSKEIIRALSLFDRMFAHFEFSYVSYMVPVKTITEYESLQEVIVLFSETLEKAIKRGYLTHELVDNYDPTVMFSLPRLSIIYGIITSPNGPIKFEATNLNRNPLRNNKKEAKMSPIFKPFTNLLYQIKKFIDILSPDEITNLETSVCNQDTLTSNLELSPPELIKNASKTEHLFLDSFNSQPLPRKRLRKICGTTHKKRALKKYHFPNTHIILAKKRSSYNYTSPIKVFYGGTISTKHTNYSINRNYSFQRRNVGKKHSNAVKTNKRKVNNLQIGALNMIAAGPKSVKPCGDSININNCGIVAAVQVTKANRHKLKTYTTPPALLKSCENKGGQKPVIRKELLHRLFLCISGVADQLQTNFASDFRYILKTVFKMHESYNNLRDTSNCIMQKSDPIIIPNEVNRSINDTTMPINSLSPQNLSLQSNSLNAEDNIYKSLPTMQLNEESQPVATNLTSSTQPNSSTVLHGECPKSIPPSWVPDHTSDNCVYCKLSFNFLRRRHHCRNCGKIFCGKCCKNFTSLPHFGIQQDVRTCISCFARIQVL